jgi:hypothetical protein
MADKQETKEEYKITPQDVADILAGTLELLRDNGLLVGIRPAPAKDGRRAGLMVFVGGLTVIDGNIAPVEEAEQ